MRCPASGCSRSKRSRIDASTGICRSAHWIRRTPSGASARSLTSCRFVVAMVPFGRRSGGEQALVLALLPVDPGGVVLDAGEPAVDRAPQLRLTTEPRGERDLLELDGEPAAQLAQGAELVQLAEAVEAVPRGGATRAQEPVLLEVAKHARRPSGPCCRSADGHLLHG